MTDKEAMKQALEALELMYACYANPDWVSYKQQEDKILVQCIETIKSTRQAIAELESQEPVAMWLILDRNINHLQVESIQRLIDRAKHAHMTDIKLRINGQDEWYEADWLKHMNRTHPQPKAEQAPVALVIDGVLVKSSLPEKYTGHLYTHPPQRTWVGLTDEDIGDAYVAWDDTNGASFADFARAIEAKLKQKNGYAEENT